MHLLDYPCSRTEGHPVRPADSKKIISAALHFYWKHGVALRPVDSSKRTNASVTHLVPFATASPTTNSLRDFSGNYTFTIQSGSVPLTTTFGIIIGKRRSQNRRPHRREIVRAAAPSSETGVSGSHSAAPMGKFCTET